jgi:hypothetical protein
MRLYIDHDLAGRELVARLRTEGHDIEIPTEIGLAAASDTEQFTHAIRTSRVLLTRHAADFDPLHVLVLASGGHHPGLLHSRSDNDVTRDIKPRGIVVAIGKLLASGIPIEDERHDLNRWR